MRMNNVPLAQPVNSYGEMNVSQDANVNGTLLSAIVTYVYDEEGVGTTRIIYSSDEDFAAYADPVAEAAQLIQRHYLKVLCAVGLPGNIAALLAMAVLVRPPSANTFLLALLAVSDTLALLLKLVMNQLYFSLDRLSDHFCRCEMLTNVCSSYANWVLVLVAVERLVAVLLPFSRARFFTMHRLCALSVALAAAILAVHLPLIIGGVAVGRFRCGTTQAVSGYADQVWSWVNVTLYAFLPTSLLLLITLFLVLALRRAGNRREQLQGSVTCYVTSRASREARRTERTFTVMTLAAALLFVLMVLPQCLYFVLFHYTTVLQHLRHLPADKLTHQVTSLMADSTHAFNFYFYVISAKRFRHRLVLCVRNSLKRSSKHSGTSPPCTSVSRLSGRDVVSVVNGNSCCAERILLAQNGSSKNPQNSCGRNLLTVDISDKDAAKLTESLV
ncbi:hypothetical protein V1264_014125 [Littorina saxatilis]|uniref:G-protein coupled receptors family 1 profile domain-containing protein n=2 Tax=Littorina saxatilis TaxID=31220 RepID=A0AAN9GIL5_9CAEN